jgi:hypothetical protein
MRSLLITAAFCIAAVAWAQSGKDGAKPKPQATDPCANTCCYQGCASIPPISINVSPTQTLRPDSAQKKEKERAETGWEETTARWTVVLAFATVLLAGVALWQRFDLDRNSKKQLRAYLSATPQDIKFLGDDWIQAYVEIENTGSTPALEVQNWTDWNIRVPDDNRNFPLPTMPGHGKRPIAPRAKWNLGFERKLTKEELAALQIKMTRIFVWGRVEYRDIFGKRQWLTFRFQNIGTVYATDDKGQRVQLGWSLYAEPDGNDAS